MPILACTCIRVSRLKHLINFPNRTDIFLVAYVGHCMIDYWP